MKSRIISFRFVLFTFVHFQLHLPTTKEKKSLPPIVHLVVSVSKFRGSWVQPALPGLVEKCASVSMRSCFKLSFFGVDTERHRCLLYVVGTSLCGKYGPGAMGRGNRWNRS